jgi:hypothetical protein
VRALRWGKGAESRESIAAHSTTTNIPDFLLAPISAPAAPFETLSINLVTDLPVCTLRDSLTRCDSIMTVTDKFTKAVRLLHGRKD